MASVAKAVDDQGTPTDPFDLGTDVMNSEPLGGLPLGNAIAVPGVESTQFRALRALGCHLHPSDRDIRVMARRLVDCQNRPTSPPEVSAETACRIHVRD